MSKPITIMSIKKSKQVYEYEPHLIENEQRLIQNEGREYDKYNNTVVKSLLMVGQDTKVSQHSSFQFRNTTAELARGDENRIGAFLWIWTERSQTGCMNTAKCPPGITTSW